MRTWNLAISAWNIGTKRTKRRSRYPREEWPPTVLRVWDTNIVDEKLDYFVVSASLVNRASKVQVVEEDGSKPQKPVRCEVMLDKSVEGRRNNTSRGSCRALVDGCLT